LKDMPDRIQVRIRNQNLGLPCADLEAGGQESKVEDGMFKDGAVTFSVARERDGRKSVTKYKATVDGDTMAGTAESERGGQARKQEFTAKREKAAK
jgi:hypothetical protein